MPRASGRLDSVAWVPRGLCREEAAYYIGVGTTKFDEMVVDRRMPRGKRIDGRVVWDRLQIDMAFADLDAVVENSIEAALNEGRQRR